LNVCIVSDTGFSFRVRAKGKDGEPISNGGANLVSVITQVNEGAGNEPAAPLPDVKVSTHTHTHTHTHSGRETERNPMHYDNYADTERERDGDWDCAKSNIIHTPLFSRWRICATGVYQLPTLKHVTHTHTERERESVC